MAESKQIKRSVFLFRMEPRSRQRRLGIHFWLSFLT